MKDLIKKYLPKTYYADRNSEERIKLFVEHWRRLVKVNQELEQKIDSFLLEAKVSGDFGEQEYEPYFGWCDVEGCENEGCSGGNAWRDMGYWTVCYKHADDYRKNKPMPKMKQKAIDRENSRDKITGYLPSVSQNSR